MTIYLLVGIIGSGKSTWAKNHVNSHTFIVCKDKIREMIYGKYDYCTADEVMIDNIAKACIQSLLQQGMDVIIDDTWDTISNGAKDRLIAWLKQQNKGLNLNYLIVKQIYFSSTEGNVERRLQNNHGNTSKETWEMVKQLMLDKFEPPDIKLCEEIIDIGV